LYTRGQERRLHVKNWAGTHRRDAPGHRGRRAGAHQGIVRLPLLGDARRHAGAWRRLGLMGGAAILAGETRWDAGRRSGGRRGEGTAALVGAARKGAGWLAGRG
jgi:hypothetical protein